MKELIKFPTALLAKEKGYPQNIPYDHYIIGEEKELRLEWQYT